jgi:ubiquitin C-terminal hydrolase
VIPCSDYITDHELKFLTNELSASGRIYPDVKSESLRKNPFDNNINSGPVNRSPGLGNMGNTCFANSVL